MTHILTLKLLIDKGASFHDLEQFSELFPCSAPVTVESFVNVPKEFDWYFAAKLLLTDFNLLSYNDAKKAAFDLYYAETSMVLNDLRYAEKRAAEVCRDKKDNVHISCANARRNARTSASKDFHADVAPALEIYRKKTALLLKTFNALIATVFAELYIQQLEVDSTS